MLSVRTSLRNAGTPVLYEQCVDGSPKLTKCLIATWPFAHNLSALELLTFDGPWDLRTLWSSSPARIPPGFFSPAVPCSFSLLAEYRRICMVSRSPLFPKTLGIQGLTTLFLDPKKCPLFPSFFCFASVSPRDLPFFFCCFAVPHRVLPPLFASCNLRRYLSCGSGFVPPFSGFFSVL